MCKPRVRNLFRISEPFEQGSLGRKSEVVGEDQVRKERERERNGASKGRGQTQVWQGGESISDIDDGGGTHL